MLHVPKIDTDLISSKVAALPDYPVLQKELSVLIPSIVEEHTGKFASALAHEVRNPLTTINLATEMLQSQGISTEQQLFVDIILRGTERINKIVTELLNSYKPDTSEPQEHNIHEILDEVLVTNEDRILLKKSLVKKYYTTIDCKVLVNKQKLMIALTNIVVNAIEAMPPHGGELKLLTKSINQCCVLEISDNGKGISKQDLKHIFRPYFTNKPGGLGLGLSTTLDMLLLNHAKLVVKSEEGKGTSFIISFEKSLEMISV